MSEGFPGRGERGRKGVRRFRLSLRSLNEGVAERERTHAEGKGKGKKGKKNPAKYELASRSQAAACWSF